MNGQAFHTLMGLAAVLSAALISVLALRGLALRYGGAQLAYNTWALVPMFLIAYLLTLWVQSVNPTPSTLEFSPATVQWVQSVSSGIAQDSSQRKLWLGVWLIGCALAMARLIDLHLRFARSLGDVWRKPGSNIQLAEHGGPMVMGLFRPKIVLPSDFAQRYSPDEQRLIIAHEQTHLDRGDLIVNAFASLLIIIFWFNPLIYFAASRLRIDQELSCDAAVLAHPSTPPSSEKTYAEALVKTLTGQSLASTSPTSCHWQSRHPLKERIMQLKPRPTSRAAKLTAQLSVAAVATIGALASSIAASTDAKTSPAPGPNQFKVEFDYTATKATDQAGVSPWRRQYVMLQDEGKEASFKANSDGSGACDVTFTINPVGGNKVSIDMPMICDGRTSNPKLVTELGKLASIEMGIQAASGLQTTHKITFRITR